MKQLIVALALMTASARAAEPELSPFAPVDKPVSSTTDKMNRAIAPYVEQARKSWPGAKKRYLAGLPKGQIFFVTVQLVEGSEIEQCFVQVTKVAGGKIQGTLATDPIGIKKLRRGDPLTVKESEIVDWMIAMPDGSEEGNVVGKFLDTWQG